MCLLSAFWTFKTNASKSVDQWKDKICIFPLVVISTLCDQWFGYSNGFKKPGWSWTGQKSNPSPFLKYSMDTKQLTMIFHLDGIHCANIPCGVAVAVKQLKRKLVTTDSGGGAHCLMRRCFEADHRWVFFLHHPAKGVNRLVMRSHSTVDQVFWASVMPMVKGDIAYKKSDYWVIRVPMSYQGVVKGPRWRWGRNYKYS